MINKKYEEKLLKNWEEVFRQGLLTFWVFIAIQDDELSVGEIQAKVTMLTKGTYQAAEQTLYRLLRKQYELEVVDYREVPGSEGPPRKLYRLSSLGRQLLHDFIKRNISLFDQPEIKKFKKG